MKRILDFTYKCVFVTTVFCIICNTLLMIFAPQAIGYMSLGFQFVGTSYFLAIGKVKQGGILSLSRGILFLFFSLILNAVFHRTGLLCAYSLTELAASIITIAVLFYSKKQSAIISPA